LFKPRSFSGGYVMKKMIFIGLTILILLSGSQLFANTSLTGAYGYFTIPITSTPSRGEIRINSGYIFGPGNFYVSLNTSLIKNWELSAGKEILVGDNAGIGATPFVVGSKYMFYGKGGFRAAGGIQVEILGDEAGVNGIPIIVYAVLSENAGKLGYFNFGLGYTFGVEAGYNINFFAGMRRAIIQDKLYVIGEFTNFSVRHGLGLPWDENRGVFNTGLMLELIEFLKFKLVVYDVLDNFITVGLGAEVKFKVF
jgi:hypothetical protein